MGALAKPLKGQVDPNAPDGVWWTEELPAAAGGPLVYPDMSSPWGEAEPGLTRVEFIARHGKQLGEKYFEESREHFDNLEAHC